MSSESSSTCTVCKHELYNCEIRTCPKSQQKICRYCCMKCEDSENDGIGQICEEANHGRTNNSTV
jgi:hypothetical protein